MTLGGWLVMILSVGTVSSLFFWCIYRISVEKSPSHSSTPKQRRNTASEPEGG